MRQGTRNRPGFSTAAAPDEGKRLYEHFSQKIASHGVAVANGIFGAEMKVSLVNDGPVTIWLDTAGLASAARLPGLFS